MASTFTCCWTDHSKGCARIEGWKYKDDISWFRASHAKSVELGYSQPMTEEELQSLAERFERLSKFF